MGLSSSKPKNYQELLDQVDKEISEIRQQTQIETKNCKWMTRTDRSVSLIIFIIGTALYSIALIPWHYLTGLIAIMAAYNFWSTTRLKSRLMKLESKLKAALQKKARLLEEVKNMVPYAPAREILEKYNPPVVMNAPPKPPPPAEPVKREVLVTKSNFLEKIGDMLIGETNSSRGPLVCKACKALIGLVPKEEMPYLSFKCARCKAFNPPEKVRPEGPKLPLPRLNTSLPAVLAKHDFKAKVD